MNKSELELECFHFSPTKFCSSITQQFHDISTKLCMNLSNVFLNLTNYGGRILRDMS